MLVSQQNFAALVDSTSTVEASRCAASIRAFIITDYLRTLDSVADASQSPFWNCLGTAKVELRCQNTKLSPLADEGFACLVPRNRSWTFNPGVFTGAINRVELLGKVGAGGGAASICEADQSPTGSETAPESNNVDGEVAIEMVEAPAAGWDSMEELFGSRGPASADCGSRVEEVRAIPIISAIARPATVAVSAQRYPRFSLLSR